LFLVLPVLLWPLSFIALRGVFIYALLASTFVLTCFSFAFNGREIGWRRVKGSYYLVGAGIAGALILYLMFYAGNLAASAFGIRGLVGNVYQMIYGSVAKMRLIILLAFIGVFEEIYWRGALQRYAEKKSRNFRKYPWVLTTLYYSIVHIAALNPILVLAALLVGLMTSLIAYRYGVLSSIITHVVWIELIVVFLPVMVR
jgi:membrane protease YdiL (CAAX protease family)